jgi:uncharacterized protein YjgD (DUF1641 family)
MAQPIPLKIPPRDPKQELLARLEQAPAEHAAALLDSYELLQQLHEHGIFSILRGTLTAGDKIVEVASERAKSDESVRAIRNVIILAKMLGSIDPDLVQSVAIAAGETFGDAKSSPVHPPGTLSLFGGLTNADSRRGLSLVMRFFQRLGSRLNPQRSPEDNQSPPSGSV